MTSYVLVHGMFADGWYWGETATLLEKDGHRVHIAELPSTGTDPSALGGLVDDVGEVRTLVAAAGEPVVLVGHSYGGMVITELADDPGVAHSVYLSAAWLERGQTLMDMELGPLDWVVPTEDGAAVRVTDDVDRAAEALCADLDPTRRAEWHGHLMYSAAVVMGTPAAAPDRAHPVTYVVLENDNVFPPGLRRAMAARADHVERMATAHVPQLTDPDGLAAILSRIPA